MRRRRQGGGTKMPKPLTSGPVREAKRAESGQGGVL
jgi:hypothetical protein